jgi:hypothetical protein
MPKQHIYSITSHRHNRQIPKQANTTGILRETFFLVNKSITMARDEVDTSLITNDRRKRKLPSYANNADNISADKDAVVKRMKLTSNPGNHCE